MDGNRKRQQTQHNSPPSGNPDIDALASVGMRIRKAVAEGYSVPNEAQYATPSSQASQNYQLNGYANTGTRVPLPLHLSEPPSLMYSGSTMESSNSFSEWDRRLSEGPAQVVEPIEKKRKHDEVESNQPGLTFDYDF